MADADEDVIPTTSPSGADDLEDETQDFRFLAQLTSSATTGQAIIPKRGTKDFEPNPTRSQASALDAARLAMHTALSAVRVHSGRSHLVGQYFPDQDDWRWDDSGAGLRHGRCVVVYKFKSTHLKVMGQADRNNWVWLLPEEALFLLERGSLDIRWPDISGSRDVTIEAPRHEETAELQQSVEEETNSRSEQSEVILASPSRQDPQVGELPMSLQGAYASFIGKDGLTLERYSVYAGLKRAGYIVQRAPTWHDNDPASVNGHAHPQPLRESTSNTTAASSSALISANWSQPGTFSSPASLIHRLVSWLFRPQRAESCPSLGPLAAPGLYRNYTELFRALSLIPYHDPDTSLSATSAAGGVNAHQPPPTLTCSPQPPFRVHFHVWKPSGAHTYRKTAPPPPDYRIAVIDARLTSMPTLSQIGDLLDSQPEDSLSKDKAGRLETRIKHGRRNILLAVVDMGVVSYLRLSDACFGAEKLFEQKAKAGSKGKGRGGGGGRGKKSPGQRQGQRQGQKTGN
ncbi:hypothetical protein A1O3_05183 [Capronia epimyces CBS 606.96]|uniref:tRNA-splicing endonuclease subunit Sen54 N-terminal domain-containing protein n=1 Tax=Capronia epimyces CBS 606.96 TaxID=1182542 RepID=W9YQH2_9EURO|nr:uncharacterized protein A1O3_05183 [Capronia epimyces CBS 606.96]EXJ84514.1 hypothetical protein A1O3_05183 [Capronia epimyces CBS 606.96]